VGPGVDGLEAVCVRRDEIEFAGVGFEEHLRRKSGKFEIGEEDGAFQIDDGEARLRAAHDKGEGGVGSDADFVRLRDDRDGDEELQGARVVDGDRVGAAIDYDDVLGVGSDAGLDRVRIGVGAAVNGA